MLVPDTRRLPGLSGGAPLAREVTPVPAPPAPASAAAPPAMAAASGAIETSAVRGVLDGYADAFSTLNADATQRVWPGVDVRGLRRAFDQLSTQNITFSRCDVSASGPGRLHRPRNVGAEGRGSLTEIRTAHLAVCAGPQRR